MGVQEVENLVKMYGFSTFRVIAQKVRVGRCLVSGDWKVAEKLGWEFIGQKTLILTNVLFETSKNNTGKSIYNFKLLKF